MEDNQDPVEDAGPVIESFPRLSFHDFDGRDRTGSRNGDRRKGGVGGRRRSYRYFPTFRPSLAMGRAHPPAALKYPQEVDEDDQQQQHDLGPGRLSMDYGSASAVLSFSLLRGETLFDVQTRGGGSILRPISTKGGSTSRTSAAQVDVIALIHELESRELPWGDQADRIAAAPLLPPAQLPLVPEPPLQKATALLPEDIIRDHGHELTPDERKEIVHYESIYFFRPNATATKRADRKGDKADFDGESGDHIHYRYEIEKLAGKGTFGRVYRAIDHKTGSKVAVKVIRSSQRYMRQGMKEVRILQLLGKDDEQDEHCIVQFLSSFTFRSHLCLVFELLDESLHDHLQRQPKQAGMPLIRVKAITRQILRALEYTAERGIVHCDIKPENVMVSTTTWRVKLIDFGTSCLASTANQNTYIQSRFYRAPEVILGLRYSCAIDMWSLGCMLPELLNNQVLFPGENEKQQIAAFCASLGLPPLSLLHESARANIYFLRNTSKLVSHAAAYGVVRAPGTFPLAEIVPDGTTDFLDFLRQCLEWDPAKRMSACDALKHNWMVPLLKVSIANAKIRGGKLPSLQRSV